MANQITDNRTLVFSADSTAGVDDLSGNAIGTLDTEIRIAGTASVAEYTSNSLAGLLFDAGTAQNWANNVFYLWFYCTVVGDLQTKANGGFRIRFCGANVTDWFEVFVGGSDEWPPAVNGGWVQFVVDIETARTTAIANGWTNGTVPATSAIRYIGYAAVTTSMPRMLDNTWMDEIRRLPDGTPGIIVEGRNSGSTDWNFTDIVNQLGVGAGTARFGDGGAVVLNTPIQFGINDTTIHGFSDTNRLIVWQNQEFIADDLYGFSALGNVGGTTNVVLGVKSGTGGDATGAQGCVISADSSGARWSMDFSDANLDNIGLYGCSFVFGGDFAFDNAAVDAATIQHIGCLSIVIGGSVVRASVVNSASFIAVELLSGGSFLNSSISGADRALKYPDGPGPFTLSGTNLSNNTIDIQVNDPGDVDVSLVDGSSADTIENIGAGSAEILSAVTVEITVTAEGSPRQGVRVTLVRSDTKAVILAPTETNVDGKIIFGYTESTPVNIEGWARDYDLSVDFSPGEIRGIIQSGSGFQQLVDLRVE